MCIGPHPLISGAFTSNESSSSSGQTQRNFQTVMFDGVYYGSLFLMVRSMVGLLCLYGSLFFQIFVPRYFCEGLCEAKGFV